MITRLLLFLTIISIQTLSSQTVQEYDKILKIENLKFNTIEIRVYKKYAISTGLELFRFYQDNKENWKAEFYETVASKNNNGEIKIRTRKSKLNSLKNFELIWMQILDTDIIHLPKWEAFEYKLKKKNKKYEIEDGKIISSTSVSRSLDGSSYYVKIKNGKQENEIEYSNPESYLKTYPNVDELISFKELLDLLKNDFKIFIK
ncbi:hypothetical protein [Chryseobacterium limigenitum]|uniref:Uncharacterized protein n=1 Tax=Chryseobacterium limigenitum TaxID=1612149 RepID=A0A1K2IQF9_9FLAO|nr:hypothetical protein [Chryseobacterium limigenitum]SFZ94615.1 hypothetical protein SAMN05216324_10798 [Chryseobacterium limigenitum]